MATHKVSHCCCPSNAHLVSRSPDSTDAHRTDCWTEPVSREGLSNFARSRQNIEWHVSIPGTCASHHLSPMIPSRTRSSNSFFCFLFVSVRFCTTGPSRKGSPDQYYNSHTYPHSGAHQASWHETTSSNWSNSPHLFLQCHPPAHLFSQWHLPAYLFLQWHPQPSYHRNTGSNWVGEPCPPLKCWSHMKCL